MSDEHRPENKDEPYALVTKRLTIYAIFAVFFFQGSMLGQWIPRIPDVKNALALSDAELGLALLSLPLGTLFGFIIAGRLIERLGLRLSCCVFLPAKAIVFMTVVLAEHLIVLCAVLVLTGVVIGLIETAMNTEAARIETALNRRLMSRCHGFWSLGSMVGAVFGGVIAQQEVSLLLHFIVVMPITAVIGFAAAACLPRIPRVHAQASVANGLADDLPSAEGFFTWPSRAMLLLCVMPLGITVVEGALMDWSAVFMREVMAIDPLQAAALYSVFATVMAVVRLSGDHITARFGELWVVRVSGLSATLGIGLFAIAPGPVWAFFAAAIAGVGVAIVFPIAVTAAARRPGRTAADNVAGLNMIVFSAFLLAPLLIGLLSEWLGLRYALLSLVPLAFLTFLLAGEVRE